MGFNVKRGHAKVQYWYVLKDGKVSFEPIYQNVKVNFMNLTNAEKEPIDDDSDVTPLLGYVTPQISHGSAIQKIKNMLGRFLCEPFRSKGYTLMEDGHKPLSSILTDILRSIKNFFMSHFKAKKTAPKKQIAPEKKNNEPSIIEVNGRKYIMYSGNKVVAVDDILVDVSSDDGQTCIKLNSREYIIYNDKLVDVSDDSPYSHLKKLNVVQRKIVGESMLRY